MNGQTKLYNYSYEEALTNMDGPVSLDSLGDHRMDLPGLMRYAREKGVLIPDLPQNEVNRFIISEKYKK